MYCNSFLILATKSFGLEDLILPKTTCLLGLIQHPLSKHFGTLINRRRFPVSFVFLVSHPIRLIIGSGGLSCFVLVQQSKVTGHFKCQKTKISCPHPKRNYAFFESADLHMVWKTFYLFRCCYSNISIFIASYSVKSFKPHFRFSISLVYFIIYFWRWLTTTLKRQTK